MRVGRAKSSLPQMSSVKCSTLRYIMMAFPLVIPRSQAGITRLDEAHNTFLSGLKNPKSSTSDLLLLKIYHIWNHGYSPQNISKHSERHESTRSLFCHGAEENCPLKGMRKALIWRLWRVSKLSLIHSFFFFFKGTNRIHSCWRLSQPARDPVSKALVSCMSILRPKC